MPKRKCPFESSISQQAKIHVSQKEMDIRSEISMGKIHTKTLDLLFKGSKNLYKPNNAAINLICNENTKDFCIMCNEVNVVICKCKRCSKYLCKECITHCLSCGAAFCASCSVKMYLHDNYDGYCLSCQTVGCVEL